MSYTKSYQATGDDDWLDTLKSIGSGALNVVTEYGRQQGQSAAYQSIAEQKAAQQTQTQQSAGMPPWLIPAGIGAVALIAIIMLKK